MVSAKADTGILAVQEEFHKIDNGGGEGDLPHIRTIKRIAEKYDIDWKMLYAVCKVESNCNADRVGDSGKSYGAFQIYLPAHPDITESQANDFEWAAEWTVKHGLKFRDNPELFYKNHNGMNKSNQWYVDRCVAAYKSI